MAKTRRPGDESRVLLIEAAARIIREEGYAALSARTLAERVGLKRQIVHYYFGTIEDLLLAVVRHYGELGLKELCGAIAEGDPIRVMLNLEADASATTFDFMAMAQHRPIIRAELRRYHAAFREVQVQAIERYAAANNLALPVSAATLSVIIQGVAFGLSGETMLGLGEGHLDKRASIEKFLRHALK